jgi:hypothetical protein
MHLSFDLENAERSPESTFDQLRILKICCQTSPGMNRRVYIAKIPFISRDLAVRLHVPLPCEEIKLLFSKCRIDHGERKAMKCGIPCCKKGVFPST